MLVGAGLSRWWPHDRAHYFFARARWSPDRLGLTLAALAVRLLVPDGAPVLVAIDDTLFRRRGKKVLISSPPANAVLDLGLCVVDMSPPKIPRAEKDQRAAATRGLAQVTWVKPLQVASRAAWTPL